MTDQYFEIKKVFDQGTGPVILYLTGAGPKEQTETLVNTLQDELPFALYEVKVSEWDRFLTPWPVSECLKNRSFTGEGTKLLRFLKERVAEMHLRQEQNARPIYIGGYSLAGLFSLWSLYETDIFDGAVCGSGSLWYPDWEEYIRSKSFHRNVRIYLCLGTKEPLVKHALMSLVGKNTELQYSLLQADPYVKSIQFDWNEGGHFSNCLERMEKGFRFILEEESRK